MNAGTYALFWVLKGQGVPAAEAKTLADGIEQVLDAHPGWAYNDGQERAARMKLYKLLMGHIEAEDRAAALKATVDAMLDVRRVMRV
jgi:hypothetical protein